MPFNIFELSIKHLQLATAVVAQNSRWPVKFYSTFFAVRGYE